MPSPQWDGSGFLIKEFMKLFDKILDGRNIFNSIFCMESYVFEKGLLDTTEEVYLEPDGNKIYSKVVIAANDLELYYALADKHNVDLIEKVIICCQQRLKWLFESKDNLFGLRVYFKLKNYNEADGKLNFRPMHTARLIDQICMVSILNCLMFDDDLEVGKRNLSDLSKLLPHNFYGNIPSTDLQFLFHKWHAKYKEYTDAVIDHCRAYQQNHSYLSEVCLDIKNFFPSISPKMLYDYIIGKLSKTYEDDIDSLSVAVVKLLYFTLDKKSIEPWKKYYYSNGTNLSGSDLYMNCGIPQGLPQSYFFGNICMIAVKRLLMDASLFKGDAYFYVDDSVIYVKAKLSEDEFRKKISDLNIRLAEWCADRDKAVSAIGKFVSANHIEFQKRLRYIIKFHEDGKSIFTHIDDADNHYGPIANFARETSMHSRLACNLDEVDDHVSLRKLEALDKVISKEIQCQTTRQKAAERRNGASEEIASHLKLLQRFKKFFLYRNRLLKIRQDGGVTADMLKDFKNRFLEKCESPTEFFAQFEEDIFQAEYRLLIQKLSRESARSLANDVKEFELRMLKKCGVIHKEEPSSLYYSKDVNAAFKMKSLSRDIYASLVRWAKENFSGQESIDLEQQMAKFRAFLGGREEESAGGGIVTIRKRGFMNKNFTLFVMKASAEYQRRILNVHFSVMMNVLPSDALAFVKKNARRLRYTELRVMAYLRNLNFDLAEFEEFIGEIDDKDISNRMGIDMGLLEVLNVFIRNARKPEWVDALIRTHRLTKGLWYNGSKFLNSYTLHDEEHAVTLIRKTLELTNRIDYFVLKDVDFYILFLACYLHDISMVIHPDLGRLSSESGHNMCLISDLLSQMKEEVKKFADFDLADEKNSRYKEAGKFLVLIFNEVYRYFESLVRDNHAKDSAKFIRDHANSLLSYLTPPFVSYVAKVAESHGYDVIDVYGLKSRAKDDTISIKYLMMLIRLADLLDVANDRVNYHLLRQNLTNLSSTSQFHWISHLVTDKIELKTNYTTDEGLGLGDKPITEEINIELYLNVKQLTVAGKHRKCENCQLVKKGEEDSLIIKINGNRDLPFICEEKECTVLCYWMMQKHDWLVKELVSLHDYLYSVNNSLFRTNINFVIHYSDEMRLDADMFDSVQEYLGV